MNASISRAIVITLSTIYLAGAASAQPNEIPNDDLRYWSMTVPVIYSDGFWKQLERPLVIACHGPSDRSHSGHFTSMIRVMSREGEVLRERRIANPRINLPEEGRKEQPMADRVEVNLTVGLARGAEVVAFYEDERQKEPSLVIDLTQEIAEAAKVAEQIRPGCQANNPPVVPIGDSGRFVLVYAVEHAARVSGTTQSDLVAQMAKQGDGFSNYATRTGLLSPTVLDLLDSATVER